jgi:hypothetical protein
MFHRLSLFLQTMIDRLFSIVRQSQRGTPVGTTYTLPPCTCPANLQLGPSVHVHAVPTSALKWTIYEPELALTAMDLFATSNNGFGHFVDVDPQAAT